MGTEMPINGELTWGSSNDRSVENNLNMKTNQTKQDKQQHSFSSTMEKYYEQLLTENRSQQQQQTPKEQNRKEERTAIIITNQEVNKALQKMKNR